MEDFNWIFCRYGTAVPLTSEWMEGLHAEGRKVYIPSPITGTAGDKDAAEERTSCISGNDHDKLPPGWVYDDLYDMMEEAGAVIRIIARSITGKEDDNGVIFFSLPDAMTLRMRVLLSFAFPYMAAEEAGASTRRLMNWD